MKKNKMMRLASALLVAVLLTTSVISGTYAKYVTSGTGTDTARVAKWGVTVNVKGYEAFTVAYGENDTKVAVDADDATVVSAGAISEVTKVIAPGTKGSLAGVAVSGTPEVDTKITYIADIELEGWTVDESFYCPIVITINGNAYSVEGLGVTTADAYEAKIEEIIAAYSTTHQANESLSNANDLAVSWEWPYSTSPANDVKDTKLGDATTLATIKFDITTTVTQID